MLFVELLLQGLVQGGIYILVAVGLTLVYGLLRILHVAHAALFTLGGYLGVLVTNATGSLALAFVVSMPLVGGVGILVYEAIYRPILHKPPFVALIASIGVFIAAEELFRILFGPYGISYAEPHLDGIVPLYGGMTVKIAELVTTAGATAAIVVLWLLSTRTRTGVAWRATVTDPVMAETFGVSVRRVRYLNFFVGSALAAAAGIMVGLLNNLVEPGMGAVPSYKALAIIVLGGLGSIPGALVASVALGVIEAFGTIYLSGMLDRDAIAFAFLIAVLMMRPRGLFARG